MRYVIVGGAGFIGTQLARTLTGQGHKVTIADIRYSPLANKPDIISTLWDVRQLPPSMISWHVDRADYVFHLASVVGPRYYMENPGDTAEIITRGTDQVQRMCLARDIPMMLLSSSEVYGKQADILREEGTESIFTDSPRWSYGMAKLLAEVAARLRSWGYEHDLTVVRPFNVVGYGQSSQSGMVFPRFLEAIRDNKPMHLHGSGEQARTFVDVQTFANGLIALSQRNGIPEQRVFNLGGGDLVTIRELAGMFAEEARDMGYHYTHEPVTVPYESFYGAGFEDTSSRLPDLSRVSRVIDWHPPTVREVIRKALASMKADI